MANEVKTNEFGVMSAAQMLAMQVGEVAGIQVLETVQQALVRRHGLIHAKPGPALLNTFHLPFLIGACVGALDCSPRSSCVRFRASARKRRSYATYRLWTYDRRDYAPL